MVKHIRILNEFLILDTADILINQCIIFGIVAEIKITVSILWHSVIHACRYDNDGNAKP